MEIQNFKKIELAYRKAPYFQNGFELFKKIVDQNHIYISELAFTSLKEVCNYLNISTQLIPSSTIYDNSHLRGEHRILDICKKEEMDHYINPIGGTELYSKELFLSQKIELNFLKPESITYCQFKDPFVPHLSILDIIMFNDIETIHNLLKRFQLV